MRSSTICFAFSLGKSSGVFVQLLKSVCEGLSSDVHKQEAVCFDIKTSYQKLPCFLNRQDNW